MTKSTKRDWQMRKADVSFALMAVFAVLGIAFDAFDTTPDFVVPPNPWLTAVAALSMVLIVGFLVTKVAAIDRRNSEEYSFQLISSGAIVAVATTLFVSFVWSSDLLLAPWLGTPTTGQVLALLLGSWSLGYFTYRLKGVHE